jgi:protein SERAC1
MWLKDLLPSDLPSARILTYGYDTDTRSLTHTSTQNIFRHAEAIVADLTRQRTEYPEVSSVQRDR